MNDNRREGQSSDNSRQQDSQQENVSNNQGGSNPQSGSQWDNYRSRTLSSGDERTERGSSDDDQEGTVVVESGLGIDE